MFKKPLLLLAMIYAQFQEAAERRLQIQSTEQRAERNLKEVQKKAFTRVLNSRPSFFSSPAQITMFPVEDPIVRIFKEVNVTKVVATQTIKDMQYTICECYRVKFLSRCLPTGTEYYWTGAFYTKTPQDFFRDKYTVEYIETREQEVSLKTLEGSCSLNSKGRALCVGGICGLVALGVYGQKKL